MHTKGYIYADAVEHVLIGQTVGEVPTTRGSETQLGDGSM